MTKLSLSVESFLGRNKRFPLMNLPKSRAYYVLSFASTKEAKSAYIDEVRSLIPVDYKCPWNERVQVLFSFEDHIDQLRNFLDKNPTAEFCVA